MWIGIFGFVEFLFRRILFNILNSLVLYCWPGFFVDLGLALAALKPLEYVFKALLGWDLWPDAEVRLWNLPKALLGAYYCPIIPTLLF